MSEALVKAGAKVVINARREEKLNELRDSLGDLKGNVAITAGDIALGATSANMVKTALDSFGRVDALSNNARIFVPKPFLDQTEEELDEYYASAVKGTYLACQSAPLKFLY